MICAKTAANPKGTFIQQIWQDKRTFCTANAEIKVITIHNCMPNLHYKNLISINYL